MPIRWTQPESFYAPVVTRPPTRGDGASAGVASAPAACGVSCAWTPGCRSGGLWKGWAPQSGLVGWRGFGGKTSTWTERGWWLQANRVGVAATGVLRPSLCILLPGTVPAGKVIFLVQWLTGFWLLETLRDPEGKAQGTHEGLSINITQFPPTVGPTWTSAPKGSEILGEVSPG